MGTEEKAKKYDEALEWMRKLYPGLHGATKEDAEHYFPELKEGEDERIRKEIISFIQDDIDRINCRVSGDYDDRDEDDIKHQNWCKKAIAYLEKQKEQKQITINQDEKEFLADEITAFLCNYDKEFDGEDPVPSEVAEHFYLLGKQAQEQKPLEWSEEDEKMMNLIKTQLHILQSHLSHAHSKSMSDMEYSSRLLQIEKCVSWLDIRLKSLRPHPKVEWGEDIVRRGIKEVGLTQHQIDWLKNNVFPPKQEQKPAEWNEEDKQNYKVICSIIHGTYVIETQETQDKLLSWLNSLKPQAKQEQKDEVKRTGWIARDSKYNSYFGLGLVLFKGKPRRSGECWSGTIAAQLPWEIFPKLKWEDEPIEVELTIRRK